MKRKSILIIGICIIVLGICIFIFFNNQSKNSRIGNNSSSQDVVDYILNIRSYQATLDIEVISNKNTNKYKIKQQYMNSDSNIQEVVEPSNIQGIKIIKEGNNLKLENSKLNLSNVLENYSYISDNVLDLNSFIKDYREYEKSRFREEDNQIIMETQNRTENKYTKNKTLYIDKSTGTPTKMDIKDTNQNTIIHIIYSEVDINN